MHDTEVPCTELGQPRFSYQYLLPQPTRLPLVLKALDAESVQLYYEVLNCTAHEQFGKVTANEKQEHTLERLPTLLWPLRVEFLSAAETLRFLPWNVANTTPQAVAIHEVNGPLTLSIVARVFFAETWDVRLGNNMLHPAIRGAFRESLCAPNLDARRQLADDFLARFRLQRPT